MKARWRWLWWTVTSWRRTRRDDNRPGSDDQWADFPHNLDRFNDNERADRDERGQP